MSRFIGSLSGLFVFSAICTWATLGIIDAKEKTRLRSKYEQCINTNVQVKLDQLALLEYQDDNRFLIWEDYMASKSYIDFMQEKADNLCKGD